MWRSRSKSSRNGPLRRTPSNPDFNPQSFKDIETLFAHGGNDNFSDLNNIQEQPSSSSQTFSIPTDVKRLSIFHRVNLANRFTRAFSARPKPDPEELYNATSPAVKPEKSVKPVESMKSSEPVKSAEQSVEPVKSAEQSVELPVKSGKPGPRITIPGAEKRVVVYMTSLRVVRSTFEACRTVRSILQGFRVPVDERDLSMDSSFLDEIQKIMIQIGLGSENTKVTLPRVFIGGRYIGGAEEVVELHEIGELKKFVSGLPAVTPGVCEICGGFRFILCYECDGSHKCHLEDGGFSTCTVCNENGLIRCPYCLSS